jgi:23S rRNA pseudouridine2605 synthase
LIDATGLSRRKAFAAIREGRVSADGETLLDPSQDLAGRVLRLDGLEVEPSAPRKVYLLLNKPPGYITTTADERGRPTVLDLVPAELRTLGLHPAGRLDFDTGGLLILTNDGDLTYRLTHPSHDVEKEYWVGLQRRPSDELLNRVWQGIEIDGAVRQPAALERLSDDEAPFHLTITIAEGRKRQVRRMFESAGARIAHLKRVREGSLRLGDLPQGAVRALTPQELRLLQA